MGWSKSGRLGALLLGSLFAGSGCGGADSSNGAQAGAANPGGSGGSGGGSTGGSGAAGDHTAGGSAAGTTVGALAGEGGVAPTGNVYVDQLRGREGCLPRPLPLATPGAGVEAGQVSCTISQVTFPIVGAICKCDTKPATPAVQSAIKNSARQSGLCGSASGVACDSPCACDLPQHSGAELMQCQTDANTPSAEMPPGFCYVDATAMPPIGSPALVADCPASSARELRITGPVPVESQPVLFLGCTAAQLK